VIPFIAVERGAPQIVYAKTPRSLHQRCPQRGILTALRGTYG
jgi:hypothetical protein